MRKKIRVRNKPGRLIQKPPIGVLRPFISMVYNGKKVGDEVLPVEAEWEVPADQYHLRMLAKGELLLVDEKPKKEKAKPKAKDEDKK